MRRGRPKQKPQRAKGAQLKLTEDDDFDPYAVVPEDALMAARTAVKDWRFAQLSRVQRFAHLDGVTEWYLLAWDCFKAASFPADEALKLARVVGVGFDADLRDRVLHVKGGDVVLWDSQRRADEGTLGAPGGAVALDALHAAAQIGRAQNLGAAQRLVEAAGLVNKPEWKTALRVALEVLPVPGTAIKAASPLAGAAADAGILEELRALLHGEELPVSASRSETGRLFGDEG